MKMNKDDIHALKSKHRLELVMQETGECFEVDATDPNQWRSLTTSGLVVNVKRQIYEIVKPGMDIESGDVLAWLKRRYAWSFKMAVRYLQGRTPDPKQEAMQPARAEIKAPIIRNDEGEKKPLDKWQEKALQIGGERMRPYFSRTWYDLVINTEETRIEPAYAPEITICPRCGKPIDWHIEKAVYSNTDLWGNTGFKHDHIGEIPIRAYSIKKRMDISDLEMDGKKDLEKIFSEAQIKDALREKITNVIRNFFDGLTEGISNLFAEEEDGIVCLKCAWKEYDFQIALDRCKTSAHRREQIEYAEQRKQIDQARFEADLEREREEQRMNYVEAGEAALPVTERRGRNA